MTIKHATDERMEEIRNRVYGRGRRQFCEHIGSNRYETPIFEYQRDEATWPYILCAACAQDVVTTANTQRLRQFIGKDCGEAKTWVEVAERLKAIRECHGREISFVMPTLAEFRNQKDANVWPVHIPAVWDEQTIMEQWHGCRNDALTPAKFHIFIHQTPYHQSGTDEWTWQFTAVRLMEGEELEPYRIYAEIKTNWKMIRLENGYQFEWTVWPGLLELKRTANPFGHKIPWLALRGVTGFGNYIGMAEPFWRRHSEKVLETDLFSPNFGQPINHGDYAIEIHESGDRPQGPIALMR